MNRILKWLWFPDRNVRIVKADSWTHMLIDDLSGGSRQRVTIINPGCWILTRFIKLPREAFEEDTE